MRLTFDGRSLVYVAGKGAHPPTPIVTVRHADGSELPLGPGHSPGWVTTEDMIAYCPPEDGFVQIASDTGGPIGIAQPPLPAGNSLAAVPGKVAVHRTDPRRVLCSWRSPISGATVPALSDDGEWLAYLLPDQPPGLASLLVERADGEGEPRILATGAITNPRFGGRTLVWQSGGGTIGGCADVGNPHVEPVTFPLPGWKCYEPVPVWVAERGQLLVLFLADEGERSQILVAEWGSLQAGAPHGYMLGWSTGSGYEHDARPLAGGDLRVRWFTPGGLVTGEDLSLDAARSRLVPPMKPLPPPVPPDIPWTTDLSKRVDDLLPYVRESSTHEMVMPGNCGILWCHKSPERDNWGEWFGYDAEAIGLFGDTSTGTRMVSLARDPEPNRPHKNLTRTRLSPEEILDRNAKGANLGDPLTLPLAGYRFTPNALFIPRRFTGRFERTFDTFLDWWDLPEFGGQWELHTERFTIIAEAGYGRYNGYEVFVRTHYGKPDAQKEFNYWGPQGRIRFENIKADGTVEEESVSQRTPGVWANARGPYVAPRQPYAFPITPSETRDARPLTNAPPERPPVDDRFTLSQIDGVLGDDVPEDLFLGALKRFRDEVCLERDKVASPANDSVTGGALLFFARGYSRERNRARFRWAPQVDASVAGLIGAAADYRRAVGIVVDPPPVDPGNPPPTGTVASRLRVESGRLRDDAGWVNYQGMSAFCLIGHAMQGRRAEAVRQIRRAARSGRNALRVFCMLQPTAGNFGPVSEFHPEQAGWEDAAAIVIDEAAALGLRVQLNLFADCAPGPFGHTLFPTLADKQRVLQRVARRFKDHPAVWFRLWNEARQNGASEGDDPVVLALADELAQTLGHRDFAISDVLDDGSESGSPQQRERIERIAAHCNIGVSHPDRAEPEPRRVRTVEHIEAVWETFQAVAPHQALIFDEPRGFASVFQPGRRENRPAVAVAEACTAAVLGCGVTYHHIAEQDDATPGLDESRIALTIPTSPDYHYRNANLGGSWIGPVPPWDKVRPCHNGQRGYAAAIGDQQGPIVTQDGWVIDTTGVIDSGDGDQHVYFALAQGRRP